MYVLIFSITTFYFIFSCLDKLGCYLKDLKRASKMNILYGMATFYYNNDHDKHKTLQDKHTQLQWLLSIIFSDGVSSAQGLSFAEGRQQGLHG